MLCQRQRDVQVGLAQAHLVRAFDIEGADDLFPRQDRHAHLGFDLLRVAQEGGVAACIGEPDGLAGAQDAAADAGADWNLLNGLHIAHLVLQHQHSAFQ